MKVVLFGTTGMLGNYVKKYLEKFYDVWNISRNSLDLSRINKYDLKSFINPNLTDGDVIINCAGMIKQREYSPAEMIMVNSVFPNLLSEINAKIIHVTTDCVYSGEKGFYNENDESDVNDDYGMSKYLGENKDLTIIRTSIIGEEIYNKLSLLEWVKSNKGKEINGYTNHLWNGVTCLELAKLMKTMIEENNFWKGVRHIHSPNYVSKYDLVSMINKIYDLGIKINLDNTSKKCFRNLTSVYDNPITIELYDQIKEMKEFKYDND
jgi:dTDP-4-dehydrorhamnose reductase